MIAYWRRLRHSLSARLLLLFIVASALIVAILSITVGMAVSHQFKHNIRPHIAHYVEYLLKDIGDPPDIGKAQVISNRVPVDIHIRGPQINWDSSAIRFDPGGLRFKRQRGGRVIAEDEDDRFILRTRAGAHRVYFVVEGRARHGFGRWIALGAIAILLLVLYLTYRAIAWLFRPIEDIRAGVQLIGAGQLDYRIAQKRADELGELSASINAMAEQITQMLEAKRQLLLAISHELRSPITRARVSLELLEPSPQKADLARDIRAMETLIAELLETERLNAAHQTLQKSAVSINQLVNEVVAEFFQNQSIASDLASEDPYLMLDGARIKILIKNLLDNAIRYNRPEQGPVRIATSVDQNDLTLVVADHGAGIERRHLDHLTEPFYRVDSARQRKTGGYGLGLYLCRVIAEAHGGRLSIESDVDAGTRISISIPHGD